MVSVVVSWKSTSTSRRYTEDDVCMQIWIRLGGTSGNPKRHDAMRLSCCSRDATRVQVCGHDALHHRAVPVLKDCGSYPFFEISWSGFSTKSWAWKNNRYCSIVYNKKENNGYGCSEFELTFQPKSRSLVSEPALVHLLFAVPCLIGWLSISGWVKVEAITQCGKVMLLELIL